MTDSTISTDWQEALDSARRIAAQHHAKTLRKAAAEIDEAADYTKDKAERHGMDRAAAIVRARALHMLHEADAKDIGPFYSPKDHEANGDTHQPTEEGQSDA